MFKRFSDVIFSFMLLAILFPLFFIMALWIKFDSAGPIFFRQERVGKKGKLFRIHKFRTMYFNTEKDGKLTIGLDSRITSAGNVLRKYKLDELPQLIDVLFGSMSLVGPRPEVPDYVLYYSEEQKQKILSIRPGITDLASIDMIDENDILAEYEDAEKAYVEHILPHKIRYYIDYVDHNNFILDLKIIFKTIFKIIMR